MQVIDNVRVVLVNPSHPGNVGAVARAMKNMAVSSLCLVAPNEYPDPRAVWRSAGAKDWLDKAMVVDTLDEALADCQLIVGTSARGRRIPWPVVDARECAQRLLAEPASSQMAILFGREDSGLTNDELQRCHLHVHVPTNPDYSSLNLAMAVQILCYELRMGLEKPEQGAPITPEALGMDDWDAPMATADDVERFFEHLEATLQRIDFLDVDNPRQLMTRLRRLFSRTRIDQLEVNILRGILSAVDKTKSQS